MTVLYRRHVYVVQLMVLSIAGSGFFAACSRPSAASDPPAVTVEDGGNGDVVMVTHPEQFPLAAPEERRVHFELQAPGVVAPDVARTVPVLSLAHRPVGEGRAPRCGTR